MSELFLGTSGWSYDSWIGDFYPDGTRKSEIHILLKNTGDNAAESAEMSDC